MKLLQAGGDSGEDASQLSTSGETFLHLATRQRNCDNEVFEALVGATRLGQRDEDGKTAVDRAREEGTLGSLLSAVSKYLTGLTVAVDREKLEELVMDGWIHWPQDEWMLAVSGRFPEAMAYIRGSLNIPVSIRRTEQLTI